MKRIRIKKDVKQTPRYREMLWEVYDKLEEKWEEKYMYLSEMLQDKADKIKEYRELTDVLREDYHMMQDELTEVKAELRVNLEFRKRAEDELKRIRGECKCQD